MKGLYYTNIYKERKGKKGSKELGRQGRERRESGKKEGKRKKNIFTDQRCNYPSIISFLFEEDKAVNLCWFSALIWHVSTIVTHPLSNLDSILKSRHHFANKLPYSQSYDFSSNNISVREVDHKEGWVRKNWYFQIVVLEKILESPLDSEEIKSVNPKGNQPWIIGRTDAKAEAPVLRPSDVKSWLIRKDPDAVKDWGQEKKRVTEDEMVEWYCQLNGHEFEQTQGDREGQGSMVCYSLCGCKESNMT